MHPSRKQFLTELGYCLIKSDLCTLAVFHASGVIGGASGDEAEDTCWNLCWSHYRRHNPRVTASPGSAAYHFYQIWNQSKGE